MSADRPQGPIKALVPGEPPIDPELRIGHVHLRTADIDRVRDFYVGIMGFDVVFQARDVPGWAARGTSCSSPPAVTTTTSASTRGCPRAVARRSAVAPGCTTSR